MLFDWLGLHGTFWLYSGVGVVMTITGAIIIPDNRFYSFTTRYRYKDFPNISEAVIACKGIKKSPNYKNSTSQNQNMHLRNINL